MNANKKLRQLSAKQARDHWGFPIQHRIKPLQFIKVQFWLRPWSLQWDVGRKHDSRRECTRVSGRAVEIQASSFWKELSFLPWLGVELGLCAGSLFDTHIGCLAELPLPQLTSPRPFPPCYLHFTQISFKFLLLNKPVLSLWLDRA